MNLHSAIFDPIRVPPRAVASTMGPLICAQLGVEPIAIRNGARLTETTKAARDTVLIAMRHGRITDGNIGLWFGVGAGTVTNWFARIDEDAR